MRGGRTVPRIQPGAGPCGAVVPCVASWSNRSASSASWSGVVAHCRPQTRHRTQPVPSSPGSSRTIRTAASSRPGPAPTVHRTPRSSTAPGPRTGGTGAGRTSSPREPGPRQVRHAHGEDHQHHHHRHHHGPPLPRPGHGGPWFHEGGQAQVPRQGRGRVTAAGVVPPVHPAGRRMESPTPAHRARY